MRTTLIKKNKNEKIFIDYIHLNFVTLKIVVYRSRATTITALILKKWTTSYFRKIIGRVHNWEI